MNMFTSKSKVLLMCDFRGTCIHMYRGRERLHDLVLVPKEGIGVEVLGGVEPQAEPFLSVAHSVYVNVGLNQIWLTACVSQELEIKLIMIRTL